MVGKAVHFGGGNIGRGFVGEKLFLTGYELIFVDVVDSLIDKLNSTPSYEVIEVSTEGTKKTKISNYRAINSKTHLEDVKKEIAEADIVTCAVGPAILKFIAPAIAAGIELRTRDTPVAVIACENAIGGTDQLKAHILEKASSKDAITKHARFANAAVDRIVPAQAADAGLDVTLETYFEWVVEKTPFGNNHPEIQGVTWVDDLEPFIKRKLFTVNTAHAAAAYYGYNSGKTSIAESMQDKKIHDVVRAAVGETATLIVKKYGIAEKDQIDYVEKIIKRISNPHLEDTVVRVGRAPLRKLGPSERFFGPANDLAEMGESTSALLGCVEEAFRFTNVPDDGESEELAKILKENDAKTVVEKVTKLKESDKLFPKVLEIVKKVQG